MERCTRNDRRQTLLWYPNLMKIYLSRWVCLDVDSNLRRVGEEADMAAAHGADLVVFPESFLHGYKRSVEPARVRARFAEISLAHPSTAFVFGSFSEEGKNRMTVWAAGKEAGRYDKVHLFQPNGEFEFWTPGDRYAAFTLRGFTWGLVNCNDIRFPEQTRALKLKARCHAFIAVAWWPWRRDHVWRALLQARAIENAAWSLGCCVAASEYPEEPFAGAGNHVFNPLGDPVYPAEDRFYDLDLNTPPRVTVDPLDHDFPVGRVETFFVH